MHSCEATFGYAMLNAALELLIKASNAGLTLLFSDPAANSFSNPNFPIAKKNMTIRDRVTSD